MLIERTHPEHVEYWPSWSTSPYASPFQWFSGFVGMEGSNDAITDAEVSACCWMIPTWDNFEKAC